MNPLKAVIEKLIFLFPTKKIIVFESLPDYADNTRAVFDEMVKRGLNRRYQLVWTTHASPVLPAEISRIPHVKAVQMDSFLYKYYYSYFAGALLVSNYFMQRRRPEQYYLYLAHGAAFKAIKDKRYSVPKDCYGCDFAVYSDYIGHYDIMNLNADESKVRMVELGYARNDVLMQPARDITALFPDRSFRHMLYWLPTFRKKTDADFSYTAHSVPFIHDREAAQRINQTAKEQGVLLVMKPHPAQDMRVINKYNLSNIVFIDNDFLSRHHITNYEMLAASDALLSDYSSVYYDYLLCDKPIGLCWEDFDEYSKSEGFTLDPTDIMRGGVKLYREEDLCAFIADVAGGADALKEERAAIRQRIHKHTAPDAAARTVDHILSNLNQ